MPYWITTMNSDVSSEYNPVQKLPNTTGASTHHLQHPYWDGPRLISDEAISGKIITVTSRFIPPSKSQHLRSGRDNGYLRAGWFDIDTFGDDRMLTSHQSPVMLCNCRRPRLMFMISPNRLAILNLSAGSF
jgi:hypothetical protein